jgi:KaiC/GvpD/RAD55 family RecA-like ATPase
VLSFGWDIAKWESEGRWAFVDVSPEPNDEPGVVGSYDLGGLLSRIQHAVRRTNAKRIAVDSLNALFVRFTDRSLIRAELFRITSSLKAMGLTVLFSRRAHRGLWRDHAIRHRGVRRRQRRHPSQHFERGAAATDPREWSVENTRREYAILRDEIARLIRRRARAIPDSAVDEGLVIIDRVLDQSEEATIRAFLRARSSEKDESVNATPSLPADRETNVGSHG